MKPTLLFQATFTNGGAEHYWWLAAGAAGILLWIFIGRQTVSDLNKRRLGLFISLIPVVTWMIACLRLLAAPEPAPLDLLLPFNVCYFLNLLMPVMLWRRSAAMFDVFYFIVMAGSLQALLTPDIPQAFPDMRNLRYFIVHIGLVQSILYAIFVYGFRPTWSGMGRCFMWLNIYFIFVAGVNLLLGTNFMYLRHKPPTTTLLDLFGEWPWYILGGEVLALALFTVVMLPFLFFKPGLDIRPDQQGKPF